MEWYGTHKKTRTLLYNSTPAPHQEAQYYFFAKELHGMIYGVVPYHTIEKLKVCDVIGSMKYIIVVILS